MKNKKIRNIFCLIIITIILVGCFSGCVRGGSERDFVSYLEKKYPDDSFEFVSFEGGKLFGGERLKEGRCKSENLIAHMTK